MKRPLLITILIMVASCKKGIIVQNLASSEHFVEMYSGNAYEVTFYHNGNQVEAYTPPNTNMTGFKAQNGDSVRLRSVKMSNGLFTNWVKVDGTTVADTTFWVVQADTINISYVLH